MKDGTHHTISLAAQRTSRVIPGSTIYGFTQHYTVKKKEAVPRRIADTRHVRPYYYGTVLPTSVSLVFRLYRALTARRPLCCATLSEQASAHVQTKCCRFCCTYGLEGNCSTTPARQRACARRREASLARPGRSLHWGRQEVRWGGAGRRRSWQARLQRAGAGCARRQRRRLRCRRSSAPQGTASGRRS